MPRRLSRKIKKPKRYGDSGSFLLPPDIRRTIAKLGEGRRTPTPVRSSTSSATVPYTFTRIVQSPSVGRVSSYRTPSYDAAGTFVSPSTPSSFSSRSRVGTRHKPKHPPLLKKGPVDWKKKTEEWIKQHGGAVVRRPTPPRQPSPVDPSTIAGPSGIGRSRPLNVWRTPKRNVTSNPTIVRVRPVYAYPHYSPISSASSVSRGRTPSVRRSLFGDSDVISPTPSRSVVLAPDSARSSRSRGSRARAPLGDFGGSPDYSDGGGSGGGPPSFGSALSNRSFRSVGSNLDISQPRTIRDNNFQPVEDFNTLVDPNVYNQETLRRHFIERRTYRRTPVEVRYRADGRPIFVLRRRLTYEKIPSSYFPSVNRPNTIPMRGAIRTKNRLLRRLVALKQLRTAVAGNNNQFSNAVRNRINFEYRRTKGKYDTYDYRDALGRQAYQDVQNRFNLDN